MTAVAEFLSELEGAAGGTLPHLVGPDLGRRPATPISYVT
jgi:hypothetical protein